MFGLNLSADPDGRAGLRPIVHWDCGFEYRRGYRCLYLASIVGRQAEVSATGRSLFQSRRTVCVCVCVRVRVCARACVCVCVSEYDQVQQ
jgi:hypothetical protein